MGKMRKDRDTGDATRESRGRSVRRQRHRRRTERKKDRKPPATPSYFSIEATIMTKPKNECTVFRGSELREEVVAEAVLHADSWNIRYTVRFTNKNLVERARHLRGGDKILVTKGRFEERPKREERELRVAEFLRI